MPRRKKTNNILSKVVDNYAVVIDDGNQVRDENNMKVIERVYRRLRDDKEIQAQIEGIRGHEWVRVVEGKMLVKSSPRMEPTGLHTCAARYWPEYEIIMDNKIVVFQDTQIRKVWHDDEWYFSVVDIVKALTDSPNPRQYWGKVKDRAFKALELSPIWVRLKLPAEDSKLRFTDCVNTESAFRLIQSIPSRKAEPFKRWLAHVGFERIKEIEIPELAQERMKEIYEQKGYSKSWIDKRLRGIAVRQDLTDEWQKNGVTEQIEFAILTAEISKASFGLTPSEYKKLKGLKNETLRDHMTDLELIFSMLGEHPQVRLNEHKIPNHSMSTNKHQKQAVRLQKMPVWNWNRKQNRA